MFIYKNRFGIQVLEVVPKIVNRGQNKSYFILMYPWYTDYLQLLTKM